MKRRATTLVELLICLIILGLCAGALLNSVGQQGTRSTVAADKLRALGLAKDELEKVQREAREGTLVAGVTNATVTPPGARLPHEVRRTVLPYLTFTNLFYVYLRVSWTHASDSRQSGQVELETLVIKE